MGDEFDAFPKAETRVGSTARVPDNPTDTEAMDQTMAKEDRNEVLGVIWKSRSGGNPHIVTIIFDPRGRRLQCVCTSAAIRGDCWAVHETRRLFGWPEPERT